MRIVSSWTKKALKRNHMHGYLNLTSQFDPLTRKRKDDVYLILVRC
jgi:hypothetical protein